MTPTEERRGMRPLFWGITWNILIAGVVSFFMDVSSEMTYAVAPMFLTALGASASVIGLVEGIAEATAAVFKFFSGAFADKFQRYKPLVTIGYLISALSRPVMATSRAWHQILGARIFDRFGKGVRTAPRDAIIASSADPAHYGRSFGLHRAMDQAGAILGPAIAALILLVYIGATSDATAKDADAATLVKYVHGYRAVIWWSLVPGILAVIATLFIIETGRGAKKEKAESAAPATSDTDATGSNRARYWYFLGVMFVFSIGNSSNAFLILRALDLGISSAMVPFAYATMNVVYTAASIPWGIWADKIGFRRVILVGFGVYAVVYFAMGAANAGWMMWVLFGAYGLFESAFEGQSRAYLARLAKVHLRGTSFGLYHMLLALTVFPASVIAGLLWDKVSHGAPFYYGATMAAAAFVMLLAEPMFFGRMNEKA